MESGTSLECTTNVDCITYAIKKKKYNVFKIQFENLDKGGIVGRYGED